MITPMTTGLIRELRAICGERHALDQRDQLRTYESDGLLQYAVPPAAVVLPATGDEVRRCVRACHAAGVPFVARGAGSGLSGGATPVEERHPDRRSRGCGGSSRSTCRTSASSSSRA